MDLAAGMFRRIVFGLVFGLGSAGAVQAQGPERTIVPSPNADYYGHDYDILKGVDRNICETACLADNRCKAFTINLSKGWCFLKDDVGELRAAKNVASGRIAENSAPAPDREAQVAERRKELGFLAKGSLDGADQLRVGLADEERDASIDDAGIMGQADDALKILSYGEAVRLYREALKRDPLDPHGWFGMARAALAFSSDDYEAKQANDALRDPAAINGYLTADNDTDKAAALDLLAQGMAAREDWKSAIKAWRASLAVKENADAQKRLDEAVASHGFRITDNSVDSNAANPRICLNFSEELAPSVTASENAGDFVSVEGGDRLPVTASGSQICVEGVQHGSRYAVVARRGIPSASGERLAKNVSVSIYVRDRDPAVRLSGNVYVLPAGGDVTMPVTTINTDVVEARLLRIGDRELARTIGDAKFLSQMASYDADDVAANRGEEVWKGFVDVQRKTNEEVVTAIPVAAILKERKPGVYVLTAKAQNAKGSDETLATQWFVLTDIGLTTFSGEDGFHVFARSLGTAEPAADVRLELVAANNEVLGTAATDTAGHARLAPGLLRGTGGDRPAVLTASTSNGDFVFLDLTGSPFDLTDRGVEGRAPAGPLDMFLTTERGIYRTGDTVHLTGLARDAKGEAVDGLTLTGIVSRPDGIEFARTPVKAEKAGGFAWDVGLPANAMRGAWSFALHTDPKQPAIASTSARVEDFEPEKIDFSLDVAAKDLDPASPPEVPLDVRYLFGAPAADLAVSGEAVLEPADLIEGFPGYSFGLADDQPTAVRLPIDETATDEEGKATVTLQPFEPPVTTKPLKASLQVRVADAGGRPVERDADLALVGTKMRIGAKPLFDGSVPEGSEAAFELLALDARNARADLPAVGWVLNKVSTDFQWYSANGRWNYEPVTRKSRVASGTLDLKAGEPAKLSMPVEWGGYELVLTDPSGRALPTSLSFEAGWYVAARSMETPDILKVSLDKPRYKVGDKAVVHIEPRFAGKAEVLVMDERVVATASADIPATGGDVTLDVTRDWGPGAYVTAVLYRPMDLAEKRMPGRAMGLAHAGVEPGDRALAVSLDAPERIEPRRSVDVGVTVAGVKTGETAYVTLAAVDVGILNITGFQPPSPQGWYFGQRRLGVEIRDLYGKLIDRMQGAPGTVRSGGDAGAAIASPPPMDDLVALFSGVVTVGPDGRATVKLDVPDFNGTLKLMAVAWSKTGVGEASRDMLVRDPVVAQVSRPPFLSPGDASRIALDVTHVEGPAGRVHLALTGGAGVVRIEANADADLDLTAKGHGRVLVPIVAENSGEAGFDLALTTPDGMILRKSFTLAVRSIQPETVKRSSFPLAANGGKLTLGPELLADFQLGTGHATLTVSGLGDFDVAGVVAALDRYPYGCTEQITSRALPLVYLDRTIVAAGLRDRADEVRERVDKAVKGVLANQGASGSFGLWSPDYGDLWLDSYVTDFLTRAKEAGYDVPVEGLMLAVDNLANQLAYQPEQPDWGPVAYAYYVLARNGRAAIGDLRYTADNEAANFKTPLAQAHLAAALALYGDRVRAEMLLRKASAGAVNGPEDNPNRSDYGTPLRDGAAVLAIGLETGVDGVDFQPLVQKVGLERAARRYTSTQEDAWSLLAAHALLASKPLRLTVDGAARDGALAMSLDADRLARGTEIVNRGAEPVTAAVTLAGVPLVAPPAKSSGYQISRSYYTLDGKEADPATIAQGARLVAVLDVLPTDTGYARLMIDDPLPAGLSIDNPALIRGGDVGALGFLELTGEAAHTEFRADRFLAAVKKPEGNTDRMRFAYIVRALSPGEFVHPAATVVDMYRPESRGSTGEGRVSVVGPRR
ncbi:alpha-2-macroglobulin family protein [Aureimonas leprariae]|uniref:Alpha-2-macroglobulin n=1 Tax=Plantimonas leprariae TaxID=2615207 RepID=A0A7V7PSI7_9HYPH|nr:alpha-2-macroglobulin family protein [Aureimonas leprariae]KAB0682534.1 hypothetical protein F6X38_00110 [Aureimonas leprariae]